MLFRVIFEVIGKHLNNTGVTELRSHIQIAVAKVFPRARLEYRKALENTDALSAAGITTPLRISHFLATIGHESGNLTALRENMNYRAARIRKIFGVGNHSAAITEAESIKLARKPEALAERVYGLGNPRKATALGNTQPGDGWRYRGNGLMGMTGRRNHRIFGQQVGVDFEAHPEYVCDSRYALLSAIEFWTANNLNALADKDDAAGICRAVNGGYNGLAHRKQLASKIRKQLEASGMEKQVASIDPTVHALQQNLSQLGYEVPINGLLDRKTERAVRAFQAAQGLRVDGIAGPITKAAIRSRLDARKAEEPSIGDQAESAMKAGAVPTIALGAVGEQVASMATTAGSVFADFKPVFAGLMVVGILMIAWPAIRKTWKVRAG